MKSLNRFFIQERYTYCRDSVLDPMLIYSVKDLVGDARKLMNSSPRQVLTAAICMCKGLTQMGIDGYVHGNMDLKNLFIETPEDLEKGIVKIGDVSEAINKSQYMRATYKISQEWNSSFCTKYQSFIKDNFYIKHPYPYAHDCYPDNCYPDPKLDSFCAGLVILKLICSFSSESKLLFGSIIRNMSSAKHQNNTQALILRIVKEIKSSVISEYGTIILRRMADIAIMLIEENPADRIGCGDAANLLRALQLGYYSPIQSSNPHSQLRVEPTIQSSNPHSQLVELPHYPCYSPEGTINR